MDWTAERGVEREVGGKRSIKGMVLFTLVAWLQKMATRGYRYDVKLKRERMHG